MEEERERNANVCCSSASATYIHTNIRFHLLKTFWCILDEIVSVCLVGVD